MGTSIHVKATRLNQPFSSNDQLEYLISEITISEIWTCAVLQHG